MKCRRSYLVMLVCVAISINTYICGMISTVRSKGLSKLSSLPTRVMPMHYPANPYLPVSGTTLETQGGAKYSPFRVRSFYTTSVQQQKGGDDIYTGSWSNALTSFVRLMKGKPTFSAMVHNFRLFLEKGIGYEALKRDIITGVYDGILNTQRREAYYLNIQNCSVTVLDDCIVRLARFDLFGLSTTASGGPWNRGRHLQYTSFIDPSVTPELIDIITLLMKRGAKTSFIDRHNILIELACVYGFFDSFIKLPGSDITHRSASLWHGLAQEYLQFLKSLAKYFFTYGEFRVGENPVFFENAFDYFANDKVPPEYRRQKQQQTGSQQTSEQVSVLKRTLTEILGLATSATDAEIKEKYHMLVRKLHPDVLRRLEESEKVVQESEQKLKKLTEVYTTYMRHAK
jgi:hypothetical protein